MLPATLVTHYLQMTSPQAFQPFYSADPALLVMQANIPLVGFYRFLYAAVGEKWRWRDRLAWTDENLHATLAAPTTMLYVLYISGTPAGYIELDHQLQQNAVEIAYFGLMEPFWGRGAGKHLLSYGVARAWELAPQRVWVHTCNLDGDYALSTYQKRGFTVYDMTEDPMPDHYQ